MDDIKWQTKEQGEEIARHQAEFEKTSDERRRDFINKELERVDEYRKSLILEYAAIQKRLLGQGYHFQNSHEAT